jgi:L-malate glycosyltransferase
VKILHTVELYHPSIGGIEEIVKHISEQLTLSGHQLTIATTKLYNRQIVEYHGVKLVDFYVKGNGITGMNGEIKRYQQFVLNGEFDLIVNFGCASWSTDAMLPILDDIKARKIFIPAGFRRNEQPENKKYFEELPAYMNKYDANVFFSEVHPDIVYAKNNNVKNIHVIPNGAAFDEFTLPGGSAFRKKYSIDETSYFILHVGNYNGEKGHEAAIEIFLRSEIKNAVLFLAGSNIAELKKNLWRKLSVSTFFRYIFSVNKRVVFEELNRQRIINAYKTADLFLYPSTYSCSPLVLFEACATGTPFLASDSGNSREIAAWTKGGEILPASKDDTESGAVDIIESAKILAELITDDERMEKYSVEGYNSWLKNFTWEKICVKYDDLYRKVTEE